LQPERQPHPDPLTDKTPEKHWADTKPEVSTQMHIHIKRIIHFISAILLDKGQPFAIKKAKARITKL
jgi:hypothetical protein